MDELVATHVLDAYRQPRHLQPGCEHFLGRCKCDTPFWLRDFSPAELARVERGRLQGEGVKNDD